MKLYNLRETNLEKELKVQPEHLEWSVKEHNHFKVIVTLTHKPSGQKITQASDSSIHQGKGYCLRELQKRICAKPVEKTICQQCGEPFVKNTKEQILCSKDCQDFYLSEICREKKTN